MSDCCSSSSCSSNSAPRKHPCPVCTKTNVSVSEKTIYLHILSPWKWQKKEQNYYFCNTPECDVVYYGIDNSVIDKQSLRTTVGIKENNDKTLICYCFGVTKKEAINNQDVKSFVIQQTKNKVCACDVYNPSGRCCLKDFP